MNERFTVAWAEPAVRDLEEIAAYLGAQGVVEPERILERIEEAARALESYPQRGRMVPELARFGVRNWRERLIRPYRLVYRIAGHKVLVLAVLDGRRNLEDLLLERILRSVEPEPDDP